MSEEKQDTGKFRKNVKDQFYTRPEVAIKCIDSIMDTVPNVRDWLWLEPSAGMGSFLHNVPSDVSHKLGLDIDPKSNDIVEEDYLTWNPVTMANKNIIVFGNPPFGRQSSVAKAFITKSCSFANVVAFILPKSFEKPSMSRVFDIKFHCIHSFDIEKDAFILNDKPYNVPCIFQIWEKRTINRQSNPKIDTYKYTYVKINDDAGYDIILRRVGAYAGQCYKADSESCNTYSVQSHYFIKFDEDILQHMDHIIHKINTHIFPSNTVGPRSLSKSEINSILNCIIMEALS